MNKRRRRRKSRKQRRFERVLEGSVKAMLPCAGVLIVYKKAKKKR